jgi:hypothetical protein
VWAERERIVRSATPTERPTGSLEQLNQVCATPRVGASPSEGNVSLSGEARKIVTIVKFDSRLTGRKVDKTDVAGSLSAHRLCHLTVTKGGSFVRKMFD